MSKGDFPLLNIFSIGFSDETSVTKYGPGQRKQYIIHYVTEGKGYFNGNLVKKGEGFLITPESYEYYFSDSNNPWSFLWVISDDPEMKKIFEYYGADTKTGIFKYSFVNVIKNTARKIELMNHSIVSKADILEIFLEFFKYHTKADTSKTDGIEITSNAKTYVDFAINYIRMNIQNNVTVNELTGILGITQTYLYKIFKIHTGKSPKEYINHYRMIQAKKMLSETDMTITQIASSLGYSDVLTFSKFFSQREKISPSKYREIQNYKNI